MNFSKLTIAEIAVIISMSFYARINAQDLELERLKNWRPELARLMSDVPSEVAKLTSDITLPLPTMCIDDTPEHPEPKELADFHKSRPELRFKFFMPKDEYEMELLHKTYKARRFFPDDNPPESFFESRIDFGTWKYILIYIESELATRVTIGDMFFIEKFIDHLDSFIDLALSHPDKDFIGTKLFNRDFGLGFTVYMAAPSPEVKGNLSDEEKLYVTSKLDKMLEKIGLPPNEIFRVKWEFGGFLKSPKGKAVLDKLGKGLLKDFKLDLKTRF